MSWAINKHCNQNDIRILVFQQEELPMKIFFVGVAFVVLAFFLNLSQRSEAYNIPDTPETREIMATIERAYDVLAIPFDTLDVNKLSEVFIDDPVFRNKLTLDQRGEAQTRVNKILGPGAAENFGYLTAMKAKRLQQQHGAKLLKAATDKAKSTNRSITEEEWKELAQQNYGERPYLPDLSLPGRFPLQFQSIEIDNDKAYVRYDDGPALQEAILVRVNGRWYVAGLIPIHVHF
jgi:hypothetical protein